MGRGDGQTALSQSAPAARSGREDDWKARVRRGIARIATDLGARSYEVGGSIRDEILGKPSKDLDVALVGPTPEELLARARSEPGASAEELVVAQKLVGVRIAAPWTPRGGVEMAIARREASTGPQHTDFAIDTGEGIRIEDDLLRRDFTVNAIAREISADGSLGEIIDPLGGVADARARILREAHPDALAEDPLRALRGLARVSRDGLTPDAATERAMRERAGDVQHLTAERIQKELNKILCGEDPSTPVDALKALRLGRDTGLLGAAIPELEPMFDFDQRSDYHQLPVDEHCFLAAQHAADLGAPLTVRWAALLHDCGKPASAFEGRDGKLHYHDNKKDPDQKAHELIGAELAAAATDRLRFTVADQREIKLLIEEHMFGEGTELDKRGERRQAYKTRSLIQRVGRDSIDDLLLLRRCDRRAKYAGEPPAGWDDEVAQFERMVEEQRTQPLTLRELAIGGNEIMQLGVQGPGIGKILGELQQRVLAEPEANNPDRLLSWAEKLAVSPHKTPRGASGGD